MKLYYALAKGKHTRQLVSVETSPYSLITDYNQDCYTSCFLYNEEQKKQFDSTKSLAGLSGNVTSKLWWDFDSENLQSALDDARTLYNRLQTLGASSDHISIAFSGKKGFAVVLRTNEMFTKEQVVAICKKQAEGLATFDLKMYDSQRIFRLPLTKHDSTGLYKIPLSEPQFFNGNIEGIKELAKRPEEQKGWLNKGIFTCPKELIPTIKEKPKLSLVANGAGFNSIDWSKKKQGWKNCKWAISQGVFENGERHTALTVLMATLAGMGDDKIAAYHAGKATIEKQALYTGSEKFSSDELWLNIIEKSVYSGHWNGGQYSCKTDPWLAEYCSRLGEHSCKKQSSITVNTTGMHDHFEQFVKDSDKNILTTGIASLDKKIKLMIGTTNGIVAAPGAGKTALSLEILNHNSKKDVPCLFFSYDMFLSAMYFKILSRHTPYKMDDVINIYKTDAEKKAAVKEIMDREYKNVEFCFKAGQSAEEIKETIKEVEDRIGKKLKLVIIDYNELIMSDMNDATASSNQTAQRIRAIANEQQICSITLMQPTKEYFDPSQEIRFMGAAKGSGAVTQALTLLLGCSRPGFDPFMPENDRYFNVTCLKNRMGPLFSLDLGWTGSKGTFSELTIEQRDRLQEIREMRDEKLAKKNEW